MPKCDVCGSELRINDRIIMTNDGKKIICKHYGVRECQA